MCRACGEPWCECNACKANEEAMRTEAELNRLARLVADAMVKLDSSNAAKYIAQYKQALKAQQGGEGAQ